MDVRRTKVAPYTRASTDNQDPDNQLPGISAFCDLRVRGADGNDYYHGGFDWNQLVEELRYFSELKNLEERRTDSIAA